VNNGTSQGWGGDGAHIYMRLVTFRRQSNNCLPNVLRLAIGQVRERGYTMKRKCPI
jgi:hypothetical protein